MQEAGTSLIAETRIASLAGLSLEEFTSRVASSDPVPGGGSASAVVAALAAALLSMVAGLSVGRPRYEPYRPTLERAQKAGEALRRRFLELADADAQAYLGFLAARRLPAGTDNDREHRAEAVRQASRAAAEVPLEMARACRDLAVEVDALAGRSNANAASDLNVAGLLVEAAARGAGANVLINLPAVEDDGYAGAATVELELCLKEIQQLVLQVRETLADDRPRDPEPRE
ncbi:MAG: cyclodeaminase/cyclohydrolase family protein [Chloroflexota bacterium]|nr:cyclodeaminase/cyclohydrolase family protein [Chloroflexota bacterium]